MFLTTTRWGMLMATGGVLCDEASDAAAAASAQAIKDAQFARDTAIADAAKLKKDLEAMKGQLLSEEDRKLFDKLKKDSETAEEARKRKEGEFDTLRTQLLEKHETELKTERIARETAETKLRNTLISREFAGAGSLFGGNADAKTVLTHDIAESYFRQYVDLDADGKVVVKNTAGQIILDAKTGKPAAFGDAITELIGTLPNKDNILRGSGKAGSGSSGGADKGDNGQIDTRHLKSQDFSDEKVRTAVKQEHAAAGGMVIGAAFQKASK